MSKLERCLRTEWLHRQGFFLDYNAETQEDIDYWLRISGLINDWVVIDPETDEILLLSTKENVEKWWKENNGEWPMEDKKDKKDHRDKRGKRGKKGKKGK